MIRTCGLYGVWGSGGKGGNFVETMLQLAGQGKPLRVVNDQRCTPSYTADVATRPRRYFDSDEYGLYHVTNAGDCTWYEFAREIFQSAGMNADLTPITSAEFGAAARRPRYSVLSNERLKQAASCHRGPGPMHFAPIWRNARSASSNSHSNDSLLDRDAETM